MDEPQAPDALEPEAPAASAGPAIEPGHRSATHLLAPPVRLRLIEALARRAQAHEGAARRLLEARIATLVADAPARVDAPPAAAGPTPAAGGPHDAAPGPLASLVEHIARHSPLSGHEAPAPRPIAPAAAPPAELKTLRYFRRTWSRLSADQRVSQSLAQVPENAGPLNSQHLVHRALLLMRDEAPEYLDRFLEYVDTLLWLEQLNAGGATERKDAARAVPDRKNGRGKSS